MFSGHKHIVVGSNFQWPAEQLCKCVDSSASACSPLNIYKLKRPLSSYVVWLKYPETSWLQTRTSGGYRTVYSYLLFALAFNKNIICFLKLFRITFLLPVFIILHVIQDSTCVMIWHQLQTPSFGNLCNYTHVILYLVLQFSIDGGKFGNTQKFDFKHWNLSL